MKTLIKITSDHFPMSQIITFFKKSLLVITDFLSLWIKFGILNAFKIQCDLINKRNIKINFYEKEIWLNPEKSSISHILKSIDKIKKMVESIPIEGRCNTIIDVGGNCGLFSWFARQRFPNAKIYVFEPSTDLQEILHLNLGADKQVQILPLAVSDRHYTANFFINTLSQQTNSLIKENAEIVAHNIVVKQVQSIKLDDFIKKNNIQQVDVLKIDVQGAEKLVLDGATETIDKTKFLILEVTFIDDNVFSVLEKVREKFELSETINPVLYGADIIFYRKS